MFYHAVLMQLTGTDAAFLARVAEFEQRIANELPYVRNYFFGPNLASRAKQFKWTVIGTFDSAADHERYQISSVHQQMKDFMAPHIADLVVCDVDTDAPGQARG